MKIVHRGTQMVASFEVVDEQGNVVPVPDADGKPVLTIEYNAELHCLDDEVWLTAGQHIRDRRDALIAQFDDATPDATADAVPEVAAEAGS